jgi:hypothetical protein
MLQLEENAQVMDIGVQIFFSKFEALHKKGLPVLLVLNDKLITLFDYKQKMSTMENDSSKFVGLQGSITGKDFLETLQLDMNIQYEIKNIFITNPNFSKYTEMDEIYRKLLKISIPSKRGGKTYAHYLSGYSFGVLVSMDQPAKVKDMSHQPLPPNQHKGSEKINKPLEFVF